MSRFGAFHQSDKKLLMGLTLLDSRLTQDKNGPGLEGMQKEAHIK
jgi:hypothetical protein